jgi:tetratricopeptide (TPR) repeat protein
MQALDAFKKSMELDKAIATTYLTLDQYAPVFTLYTTNFEEAAALYNAEKYPEALTEFKNCAVYGDYIFSNGWGLYKLDTTLTYYTALSALNAKQEEEAIKYFTKLADAKVGTTPEQATTYRYLAKYYYDKKDEANMSKYIKTGMELYPNDEYLPLLELDYIREKGDKAALYKKYEEMVAANPNNFDVLFEYGNELFLETHVADATKRPANYAENCAKIEDLYKKAIALKPDNMDAQLALGKHYYNMALFLEEDANKAKDAKKKAELTTQVAETASKSIEPLEKVYNAYDGQGKLKTHDKSNYKSACSLLSYSYDKKKDKAKSDMYDKKYNEADKNH